MMEISEPEWTQQRLLIASEHKYMVMIPHAHFNSVVKLVISK